MFRTKGQMDEQSSSSVSLLQPVEGVQQIQHNLVQSRHTYVGDIVSDADNDDVKKLLQNQNKILEEILKEQKRTNTLLSGLFCVSADSNQ